MTFAARMKMRSDTAQSSFAEQVNSRIEHYVNTTMERFEAACAAKADAGYTSCLFESEGRTVDDLWKAGVHSSYASALQALQSSFEEKLLCLGFSSMTVECWYLNEYNQTWKSMDVRRGPQVKRYRFHLSASWDGLADHQAPPTALPQGHLSQCPICLETKALVALIPCGHTQCRDCAANVTGRACPCCRQQVAGFTKGLFIG